MMVYFQLYNQMELYFWKNNRSRIFQLCYIGLILISTADTSYAKHDSVSSLRGGENDHRQLKEINLDKSVARGLEGNDPFDFNFPDDVSLTNELGSNVDVDTLPPYYEDGSAIDPSDISPTDLDNLPSNNETGFILDAESPFDANVSTYNQTENDGADFSLDGTNGTELSLPSEFPVNTYTQTENNETGQFLGGTNDTDIKYYYQQGNNDTGVIADETNVSDSTFPSDSPEPVNNQTDDNITGNPSQNNGTEVILDGNNATNNTSPIDSTEFDENQSENGETGVITDGTDSTNATFPSDSPVSIYDPTNNNDMDGNNVTNATFPADSPDSTYNQTENNDTDVILDGASSASPTILPSNSIDDQSNTTQSPTPLPTPLPTHTHNNPTSHHTTPHPPGHSPPHSQTHTPSPSPVKHPTFHFKPHTTKHSSAKPTTAKDLKDNLQNDLKDEEQKIEKVAKNPTAEIFAGLLAFFGVAGMLFTGWQVMDNPDGLCASFCRLSIKCVACMYKLFCLPCRFFCAGRSTQGYEEGPSSDDPRTLHHSLELS